MIESKTLFFINYNTENQLELQLGETQSWTRMLRSNSLVPIPGFWGGTESTQAKQKYQWQLQEWHFDCFINRQNTYYALGSTPQFPSKFFPELTGTTIGNKQNFYGKPVSQLSNSEFLQTNFLIALLSFLKTLCQKYQQLGYQQQSIIWDSLLYQQNQTDDMYQFLLLPPELTHFVAERCPVENRLQQIIPYQLPSIQNSIENKDKPPNNSQRWAYALAVLLFNRLSGTQPFATQNIPQQDHEEHLHDTVQSMHNTPYIKAQLFKPELNNLWAELLQDTLCAPQRKHGKHEKNNMLDLNHWQQTIKNYSVSSSTEEPYSLWRKCTNAQRQQAASELASELHKRQQSYKRQHFWRKKRNSLLLCAVLLLMLGTLVYTPLKRALSPPEHRNISAYQTVELYYQAIDQLQPQLHSQLSYGRDDTIQTDANMLTMLFVNIQARRAYEGRDALLPARNWLTKEQLSTQEGSPIPALSLNFVPYGISHMIIEKNFPSDDITKLALDPPLEINNLSDGAQLNFTIHYDIWFPGTLANETAQQNNPSLPATLKAEFEANQPLHKKNTDKITLIYREKKQAWYVHKIQRNSKEIQHSLPKP